MVSLAEAFVTVRPDISGFGREVQSEVGRAGDSAGKKFGGMFAGALKSAGIGAAIGAAVGGVALLKGSISAASDLNEELSKSKAVFGAASKDVIAFANTTTRSLGISRNAALQASGNFGNFFTAAGLAGDAAADLSIDAVKLAGDLASFNNLGTDEALEKLRAGLAGEAEPLAAIGAGFTAAEVKAKALSLGLIQQGQELDASAAAQARFAVILDKTQKAQGDAGKTIGGLAGQQRVFGSTIDDLKAKLGTGLLPVATQFFGFLNTSALPAVGRLSIGLSARLAPAFKAVSSFVQASVLPVLRQLGGYIQSTVIPIAARLTAQYGGGLRNAFTQVRTAIQQNRPQLEALVGAFRTAANFVVTRVVPLFGPIMRTTFTELGRGISTAVRAVSGIVSAFQAVAAAVRRAIDLFNGFKTAIRTLPKVNLGGVLGKIPGFANGGILPKGVALVGERGPELIQSRRGGERVIPNRPTQRALAAAGPTVNMPVTIYGTDNIIERAVRQQSRELAFALATA